MHKEIMNTYLQWIELAGGLVDRGLDGLVRERDVPDDEAATAGLSGNALVDDGDVAELR